MIKTQTIVDYRKHVIRLINKEIDRLYKKGLKEDGDSHKYLEQIRQCKKIRDIVRFDKAYGRLFGEERLRTVDDYQKIFTQLQKDGHGSKTVWLSESKNFTYHTGYSIDKIDVDMESIYFNNTARKDDDKSSDGNQQAEKEDDFDEVYWSPL